ncbi:L-alanine exporter AlaE [Paracoccus actinidiae]|nr:L-alanine exporter AlaE [Paracoccus sp. M09]
MAKEQRRSWQAYVADTVALILFFTATGIVNERFIAGMT